MRPDGFVFWAQAGQRHVVSPVALSGPELNALPEGFTLDASLMPVAVRPDVALEPQAGGVLSQGPDGTHYWVDDGRRDLIYPAAWSDEIDALPEGIPFNASLQPIG